MLNDGGPAFPCKYDEPLGPVANPEPGRLYPTHQRIDAPGMTLRDWFAGQAINATLRQTGMMKPDALVVAKIAYMVADAMLAEREKK